MDITSNAIIAGNGREGFKVCWEDRLKIFQLLMFMGLKSFLFSEGTPEVEIKNTCLIQLEIISQFCPIGKDCDQNDDRMCVKVKDCMLGAINCLYSMLI